MDATTAYRSFGIPSYRPRAARARIQNNKFYTVTMQDVEHDALTDYHGLAEGEYTELLAGKDARTRRDARLNHCNRVAEYNGPVWMLRRWRYGREMEAVYYYTEAKATAQGEALLAEFVQWTADCGKQADKYLQEAGRIASGAQAPRILSYEMLLKAAADAAAAPDRARAAGHTHRYLITRVR